MTEAENAKPFDLGSAAQRARVGWNVNGVFFQHVERHDLKSTLMGRCEHNESCHPVVVGTKPVRRRHTPAIAGYEARESVLRHRRREVVADSALVVQKLSGHERTNRMATQILWPGRTAAISIEARQRIGTTGLKDAAEHVLVHLSIMSIRGCPERCRGRRRECRGGHRGLRCRPGRGEH